jgi:hypothetical protein
MVVLEGALLADLDCAGAQVRRKVVQGWKFGLGECREARR